MNEQPARPAQYVFEVATTQRLTPHMIRVFFRGPEFDVFAQAVADRAQTDTYVKILFAKPELGLVPPYDLDALREKLAPADMPSRRTYTIRHVDHEAGTIAIDFVNHGDTGFAGPWAARAQPGDRLVFLGPGGGYAPRAGADEYLYFGDESALPAIAAAIEALPATAKGRAYIEVESAADELAIDAPEGFDLTWLHRNGAAYGDTLVRAIEALEQPQGSVDIFAHGERGAMKRLRPLVHNTWGIPRSSMSYSAYWAAGRGHDAFQAEKYTPEGMLFDAEPAVTPTWRA